MSLITPDPVIILDFGSQLTQNIARRVRELEIYSEVHPPFETADQIRSRNPLAIILSGGPSSVFDPEAPTVDPGIFYLGIPVLGICYGMQLMAHLLGGKVEPAEIREYGVTPFLAEKGTGAPWNALGEKSPVLMSHGDSILSLPSGFQKTGRTGTTPIAAMENRDRNLYGVQFHPEVTQTLQGIPFLKSFLTDIAGIRPNWTLSGYIDREIDHIQNTVGKEFLICALSGGIDSTVTALLCHKALGDRFQAFYVDNGLMRMGESEQIVRDLKELALPLKPVDAGKIFLDRLKGVKDPERKRKIIGKTFIDVFWSEAMTLPVRPRFLAQGTLYPDVIESISHKGPSSMIKSHHNVGGLPKKNPFQLVEPLRDLFKDEVRRMGLKLGLPDSFIHKQPFPGPGLAIRIIGSITPERLRVVRESDRIVRDVLSGNEISRSLWQYFAVLLPIQSVGVMGDQRTYENVIAIRAVSSQDGMTADVADLSHSLLAELSHRIIAEVRGVNRVVYDISPKPPSTIEWE
ncbi:GMP synthase (glutamine-hydrolyzing) [Leptospirillum ferriphilum]|uniref:GMP synthase [glutamine-hydrolyzing] n=1 Tax=Leptospirillum ferriphilum TaxID=178606 RepID=A0A094YJE3_9BACT|nr:glutamine-hydrolyzing GMP synthase [Leptospirillum ferriphilum]KGA93331.1 GMP synthase (glutamine-hydrolyzing) [Leptospirillum ferriphilum]